MLLEKFGLSEKTKNGTVAIAITIYSAKLAYNLCHLTPG
jgi:hypothetical protein